MNCLRKHAALLVIISVAISGIGRAHGTSIQQTAEIVEFGTGDARRGAVILSRKRNSLSASINTLGLNTNTAYSVWWVVFNRPQFCLEPNVCGESDVFESQGVLNADQVSRVRISVFNASGFVTGDSGVANITATLESGALPTGTFVNFGWSAPVGPGPDSNSGLMHGNGLDAEIHVVLRTHGPAVAGSVGPQISTFNGLCDVQQCEDVRAAIFMAPEPGPTSACIDTDGDGWGWDGSRSCRP